MRVAVYVKQMRAENLEEQTNFSGYYCADWNQLELNKAYKVKDNTESGEIIVGGNPLCAVNSVNGNYHFKIVDKSFGKFKGV